MKLLLDEQLPRTLIKMLPENIDASTVQSEGWGTVTNGALLKLAFERGFDALLSADKNIVSQHIMSIIEIK
jgi:predicted nuclease of predicted toxin-antitoxin system